MVAYSFAPEFRHQVASLNKRQTVRGDRKRHARPGEAVQLYTAMRTKHCRKLVDRDPICRAVRPIVIQVSELLDDYIASIEIDGTPLHRDEIEAFAAADGFAPIDFGWWRQATLRGERDLKPATARSNMGWFWLDRHGRGRFAGVVITWEPAP